MTKPKIPNWVDRVLMGFLTFVLGAALGVGILTLVRLVVESVIWFFGKP